MSSAQCPQCARPLTKGMDELCPGCGCPLLWDEQAADEGAQSGTDVQRVPDREAGEDTSPWAPPFATETPPPRAPAPPPPAVPPPPPVAATVSCPACLEPNPEDRVLCQHCGALLRAEPAPPPPPRPPRSLRRSRVAVAVAVLALAVLVSVAAGVLVAVLGPGPGRPSPPATTARPGPRLARVDPRSINARASSELPPTRGLTYSVRNTLDGDIRTAWNNNSALRGSGVGETLTYRFQSPLHLVRIALINGYAKSAELHADNGRIRGVAVATDTGTFQATLSDTADRQRLDRDFGLTRTVTVQVTSIYPGARYTDLALTEIEFWAVQG